MFLPPKWKFIIFILRKMIFRHNRSSLSSIRSSGKKNKFSQFFWIGQDEEGKSIRNFRFSCPNKTQQKRIGLNNFLSWKEKRLKFPLPKKVRKQYFQLKHLVIFSLQILISLMPWPRRQSSWSEEKSFQASSRNNIAKRTNLEGE
jgi:hypothetical protein